MIVESAAKWEYSDSPGMYTECPPIHYRNHPGYNLPVPYVKFFLKNKEKLPPEKVYKKDVTYAEMKKDKLEEETKVKRDLLPITEVMIGPIQNREKEKNACDIFLKDNGYTNVKVKISDIPYRGF